MQRLIQLSEDELLALVRKAVHEVMQGYPPANGHRPIAQPTADKKQAAGYLDISLSTLDKLLKTQQIKSFRIGRQVRIKWPDLEEYVNNK